MIELWCNDSCEPCDQVEMLLQKTPLKWKYVDVANTDFEGIIPWLVLEDGRSIVGKKRIEEFTSACVEIINKHFGVKK